MNSIINRVQLLGHAGQDPETILLENGRKLSRFSLATHETYTISNGDKVEKTHWHNIVFWDKLAEIVEKHLTKGQHVAVEGKLVTRSWEDLNGMKHYRTEVSGKGILFL